MSKPRFGAGIWHFATYVDRYATDGYGPPVSLIEAIDKAGQVGDLSVVDLNYPFVDSQAVVRRGRGRAEAQQSRRHRHHARDLHPRVRQGRIHQSRSGRASPGQRDVQRRGQCGSPVRG
jgi:hypothetical protein